MMTPNSYIKGGGFQKGHNWLGGGQNAQKNAHMVYDKYLIHILWCLILKSRLETNIEFFSY